MIAGYIRAVLMVVVFICGLVIAAVPYIHGPVRMAGTAYVRAVLVVVGFIRRPLTAELPYINGPVRMAGVA